jgi:hypothetical protein
MEANRLWVCVAELTAIALVASFSLKLKLYVILLHFLRFVNIFKQFLIA